MAFCSRCEFTRGLRGLPGFHRVHGKKTENMNVAAISSLAAPKAQKFSFVSFNVLLVSIIKSFIRVVVLFRQDFPTGPSSLLLP